uniref:Uncharacterized protein n=1 Tax=Colobus angolensis palliatus TaxID=336983 RepID=A0A2K5IST9_COLAP
MDHRGLLSPFYLPFSAKNKVGAPQPGCQALHPFTDVFIQHASGRLLSHGEFSDKGSGNPEKGGRCGNGCRGVQQLGFRCQQMVTEVPRSLEVRAPAQLHTCLGPASRIS